MSSLLFVIVGKNEPVYETDFSPSAMATGTGTLPATTPGKTPADNDTTHLNQFIIHSSLDMLEKTQFLTQNMHLKTIDRFNAQTIHAFLTAGSTAFILLHTPSPTTPSSPPSDDNIASFFKEVYELYVKLLLNPFYELDRPIVSPAFEQRVRVLEKRYLR